MKILMFGRGAIASIYGWALERAGNDVEFYVRPGRAAVYGQAINLDLLDARKRVRGTSSCSTTGNGRRLQPRQWTNLSSERGRRVPVPADRVAELAGPFPGHAAHPADPSRPA